MKNTALDATVLINLLDVNCLDLLPHLTTHKFFLPDPVRQEVHQRSQRIRLNKAVKKGWMEPVEIVDITEIEAYVGYRSRFGKGESACLALGMYRSWLVASDDRAVRREILNTRGAEWFMDTPGLLKNAINSNVLSGSDFAMICERLGFKEEDI